mmetsp:Transcript_169415/g.300055  ORF Transcript_169415/g.300055 Transcript_169415/m.300055 type:complete len:279 (+) Transcript_169415:1062-1898(+)
MSWVIGLWLVSCPTTPTTHPGSFLSLRTILLLVLCIIFMAHGRILPGNLCLQILLEWITLTWLVAPAAASLHKHQVPCKDPTLMVCTEQRLTHLTPAHNYLGSFRLKPSDKLQIIIHIVERQVQASICNCNVFEFIDVFCTQGSAGEVLDVFVRHEFRSAHLQHLGPLLKECDFIIVLEIKCLFNVRLVRNLVITAERVAEADDVEFPSYILSHPLINKEGCEFLPGHGIFSIDIDHLEEIDKLRHQLPLLFVQVKEARQVKQVMELLLHNQHELLKA